MVRKITALPSINLDCPLCCTLNISTQQYVVKRNVIFKNDAEQLLESFGMNIWRMKADMNQPWTALTYENTYFSLKNIDWKSEIVLYSAQSFRWRLYCRVPRNEELGRPKNARKMNNVSETLACVNECLYSPLFQPKNKTWRNCL